MPDQDKRAAAGRSAANQNNAARSTTDGRDMAFDPIEAALRQLHESIAAEEIPDDFLDLLDQLDDVPDADRSPTK